MAGKKISQAKTARSKGPAYYRDRVRSLSLVEKRRWQAHTGFSKMMEALGRAGRKSWTMTRGYAEYNPFFRAGLGKFFGAQEPLDIASALKKIPRSKNRPLVVVEDGAGEGVFLEQLKKELASKNVPSKTTALVLSEPDGFPLSKRHKAGLVDSVVAGQAEFFVPEGKVDAVVSFYGSLHYTMFDAKKDHLLKFAHSLRKGGIMMIGFEQSSLFKLSDNLDQARAQMQKHSGALVRAFEKRGFRARVYKSHVREQEREPKIPAYMLIVQRTNVVSRRQRNR